MSHVVNPALEFSLFKDEIQTLFLNNIRNCGKHTEMYNNVGIMVEKENV